MGPEKNPWNSVAVTAAISPRRCQLQDVRPEWNKMNEIVSNRPKLTQNKTNRPVILET